MDERKKHIDEFFRQEMGSHSEVPPSSVWDSLEKRLDAQSGASAPRKRPFPIWWFWAIGGLIVLSATAIIAGQMMTGTEQKQVSTPAVEKTKTEYAEPEQVSKPVMEDERPVAEQEKIPPVIVNNTTPPTSTSNNTSVNHKRSNKAIRQNNKENIAQQNDHSPLKPVTKQIQPVVKQSRSQEHALPAIDKRSPEHIANEKVGESKRPVRQLPQLREHNSESELLAMQTPQAFAGKTDNTLLKNSVVVPDLKVSIPPTALSIRQAKTIESAGIQQPIYAAATNPGIIAAADMNDPYRNEQQVQVAISQDTSKKKKLNLPKKRYTDTAFYEADTSILDDVVGEVVTKIKRNVKVPLEFGVKAGYSKGFGNGWRVDKWAIAPYVAYNLTSNFSLSVQPTYLSGNVRSSAFGQADQSYYQITGDGFDSSSRVVRGKIDSSVITANPPDTVYYSYSYSQTYDSISVTYSTNQTKLWEVEIPLILKYKINKNFSVFAGGTATYSAVLQMKENIDRYSGLSKTYEQGIDPQTFYVTAPNQAPPPGPAKLKADDLFTYNTRPFSEFNSSPLYNSSRKTFVRYGFMIGVSATWKDRWMVDLLMHKAGVDGAVVPDKRVQKLYTQPYFRLMVGYKLYK